MRHNFITSLVGFFLWVPSYSYAELDKFIWPEELTNTEVIFSPHREQGFVDTDGMVPMEITSNRLKKSILRSPIEDWKNSQSCDSPTRKPGYLHTTPYLNDT